MTAPVNDPWYVKVIGDIVFAVTLVLAFRFLMWVRFRK